jgi:hypothetical protein
MLHLRLPVSVLQVQLNSYFSEAHSAIHDKASLAHQPTRKSDHLQHLIKMWGSHNPTSHLTNRQSMCMLTDAAFKRVPWITLPATCLSGYTPSSSTTHGFCSRCIYAWCEIPRHEEVSRKRMLHILRVGILVRLLLVERYCDPDPLAGDVRRLMVTNNRFCCLVREGKMLWKQVTIGILQSPQVTMYFETPHVLYHPAHRFR